MSAEAEVIDRSSKQNCEAGSEQVKDPIEAEVQEEAAQPTEVQQAEQAQSTDGEAKEQQSQSQEQRAGSSKEDTSEKTKVTDSEKDNKRPKSNKIEIRLQATGDAPIMKQRKYMVEPGKKIGEIIAFVRKYLKFDETENLFLYVNQAFAPSPDQSVLNLNECFGTDGKLVLYYSRNQAWG